MIIGIGLEEGESNRLPSQPVSEPGMVEARRDESANMALRRGIQREKSGLANGLFKRGRLSFGSQV